jgi:hypothetical protein
MAKVQQRVSCFPSSWPTILICGHKSGLGSLLHEQNHPSQQLVRKAVARLRGAGPASEHGWRPEEPQLHLGEERPESAGSMKMQSLAASPSWTADQAVKVSTIHQCPLLHLLTTVHQWLPYTTVHPSLHSRRDCPASDNLKCTLTHPGSPEV